MSENNRDVLYFSSLSYQLRKLNRIVAISIVRGITNNAIVERFKSYPPNISLFWNPSHLTKSKRINYFVKEILDLNIVARVDAQFE